MYYCERHEKIIEILEKRNIATVHYLAAELHVSEPTIRRDLSLLERENKINRTFGGAVLNRAQDKEVPLVLREQESRQNKEQLAERAAELISDGDIIFLDASSTVAEIIKYLPRFRDLTIITNSPKNSQRLAELKIRSFSTGGLLLENSVAYVGDMAKRTAEGFNADLFFFSCRGLSEMGELTDSSIEETEIRKTMMKQSKKNVFICSDDKIGKKYMYNLCTYKDIDCIICNKNPEFK